jgi:hypothetical protein
MKKEDPLPDFLTTPCTHSKEFENDCGASIVLRSCHFKYFVILTDKKTITDPITCWIECRVVRQKQGQSRRFNFVDRLSQICSHVQTLLQCLIVTDGVVRFKGLHAKALGWKPIIGTNHLYENWKSWWNM